LSAFVPIRSASSGADLKTVWSVKADAPLHDRPIRVPLDAEAQAAYYHQVLHEF
jgi:hypothetical protein